MSITVEERLNQIEREVAEVKQQIAEVVRKNNGDDKDWRRVCGSMKDFPAFEEVVRLGREYRESFPYVCDEE